MFLAYLLSLTIALVGMVVLDAKFRLFFWDSPMRAFIVTAVGMAFFVLWDVSGIAASIFFSGQSPYMSGLYLAPDFPVEEVFFLLLLIFTTMNLYAGVSRWIGRPTSRPANHSANRTTNQSVKEQA